MASIKILFDHRIFTYQAYGGISRYYVRLIQGLLSLGNQAQVIAPIHRNRYLKELPKSVVKGFEFDRFPLKTGLLISSFNDYVSGLKILGSDAEIFHETYYGASSFGTANKARVITVHDMIHEKFPHEFPPWDRTAEKKRLSVARADHIICISQNTKNDLCDILAVPDEKVSVVHHGFEKFNEHVASGSNEIQSRSGRPYLLFVGSRGGYKNFTHLLKAVASSTALKKSFDVVAFGGGKFSSTEQNLISTLGFSSGAVRQVSGGDSVLGLLYSQAAVFVYPSIYEGFGLPPLEAMAHRCPVATSNSSSMPEVVGAAGAYFDPLDVEAQADAICSIVFDDDRRTQLIEEGMQRLRQFSWERCALQTQALYEIVLRKKEIR